ALVWDLTALRARGKEPAAELSGGAARAHWEALGSDDAGKGFDAVCALALSPGRAVPLLRDHLKPVAPVAGARGHRLVADLDRPRFPVRDRARVELTSFAELAAPLLRKALVADPSPEARKRLEELLARVPGPLPTGEGLHQVRALEVLEMIGTPEARQ